MRIMHDELKQKYDKKVEEVLSILKELGGRCGENNGGGGKKNKGKQQSSNVPNLEAKIEEIKGLLEPEQKMENQEILNFKQ